MPFIDGLQVTTSAALTDTIPISQGGNGIPGSATTRQIAVGDLVAAGSVQSVVGATGVVTLAQLEAGGVASTASIAATNVKAFGAVGNGTTDDTAAIQAAINSLSATGGVVQFSAGNYAISASLNIGNGTSSANSTSAGVILRGAGAPAVTGVSGFGFGKNAPSTLTWIGASTLPMVSVNGPLAGWGVQSLALNGSGVATHGIRVTSAQLGSNHDLVVGNCTQAQIYSTTFSQFGSTTTDSIYNDWRNVFVYVPGIANNKGIVLTGTSATQNSNTCYNTFDNVHFWSNSSSQFITNIYLQNCDTCSITNVHMVNGGPSSTGTMLDFSASSGNWPSACVMRNFDPSGTNLQWSSLGSSIAGGSPNLVGSLQQGNGAVWPVPSQQNGYAIDSPRLVHTVNLSAQTGAIAAQVLYSPIDVENAFYRVNFYFVVTTAGTAGTITPQLVWSDGFKVQTFSGTPMSLAAAGNFSQGSVPFIGSGAGTINYEVAASGITGSPQYEAFYNVEFIGPL